MMQNEQIKYMTERFLGWRLPENFNPDGGIIFDPVANKGTIHEFKRQPTGTNLFDYTQAEAMVRYMVDGLECTATTREGPSEGWCITMARLEGDAEISAGAIDHPLRCPPLGAPTTDSTDMEARPAVEVWRDAAIAYGGLSIEGDGEFRAAAVIEKDRADTTASYRAEITQLRDKLARARDGQSWKVVSEDTSWIDGRDVILLAHDMEIQGHYCPGEWSHSIDGDEWEGAVWSCFDDAVQFEIEKISNDLTLWCHGPVTHWRELSPRPAQLMKGQDDAE